MLYSKSNDLKKIKPKNWRFKKNWQAVFSAINDTGVKGKLWQLQNLEKHFHFTFKTTCNVKCIVQKVA